MEFRGFVWKGKFTSLTQYNEYCFFPRLLEKKDLVAKEINAFMMKNEEFKDLGLDSYVVDFVTKFFVFLFLTRF